MYVTDAFNASVPYYDNADLKLLGMWADAVGAVMLGNNGAIADIEAVFQHRLISRHAVDLFAKTLLAFAGKPRFAGALRRVYHSALRPHAAKSITHTLLHLLYTRITRKGTLALEPRVLHDRLQLQYRKQVASQRALGLIS